MNSSGMKRDRRSYFGAWGVDTHASLSYVAAPATRVWARAVLLASGLGPHKINLAYFQTVPSKRRGLAPHDEESKVSQLFSRYRDKGIPLPAMYAQDGNPGPVLHIEKDYPGTLRILLHPLFVLLCAPTTNTEIALLCSALNAPARAALGIDHLEATDEGLKLFREPLEQLSLPHLARSLVTSDLDSAATVAAYVAINCLRYGEMDWEMTVQAVRLMTQCLQKYSPSEGENLGDFLSFMPIYYGAALHGGEYRQSVVERLKLISRPGRPQTRSQYEDIGQRLSAAIFGDPQSPGKR